MKILNELLRLATPPEKEASKWFQSAEDGVKFLVESSASKEIILYASLDHVLIHSVLAPIVAVTPPDSKDLLCAHIMPDSSWSITHVSGGGQPDRVYLGEPMDSPGCKSLAKGEKLVFRRSFNGVDEGSSRTELSQKFVHALDLYWMEEYKAFCRLNNEGDIEPVIRMRGLEKETGVSYHMLITILSTDLHKYMAVTESALVQKFDFTRCPIRILPLMYLINFTPGIS